jgi:uncharacterized repeat protein (TIGR02059 family)
MKKLLLLFFLTVNLSLYGTTYYISPSGSDSNSGTSSSPFASLNKAWTVVGPGDVVYVRGGTYYFTQQQVLKGVNGTSGNLIYVWAYPGEHPVFTRSSSFSWSYPCGVFFAGDYVHFKGIEITGYYQVNSYVWSGLRVEDSNHNIFEQLDIHHNGHGFRLQGDSDGNQIINCDFHHNQDPLSSDSYGDADGLEITYLPYGVSNTVRGCRFWWNTDDGIDLISNAGYVLVENCWSWYNGYLPDSFNAAGNGNGFKLGGSTSDYSSTTLRTVRNCLAYHNLTHGFDQNLGSFIMQLYNNSSYDNGSAGFCFNQVSGIAHVLRNNIAYGNDAYQTNADYGWIHDHNTWNGGVSVSDADFLSLYASGLDDDRDSDGNLPAMNFLHLATGSDLIDAGTYVGQAYGGSAPDIGCFETGVQTSVPTPSYLSSVIYNSNPSVVELTFDLSLAEIVPATSSFYVTVNSASRSINTIYVTGTKVLLVLSSAVSAGEVVTVSYTKPSSNQLQTPAGGQVDSFGSKSVTNSVNAPKPAYLSSVIQNASAAWLEMTFNTALANVLPSVSAFTVRVNSAVRNISYVVISGANVYLALASSVSYGDVVTVAYTKPSSNPIQTASGSQADSFTAQTVTNNVTAVLPVYVSSSIENSTPSTLDVNFSLALANIVPSASSFGVMVNSTARTVNNVTLSGTKVSLTLASAVAYGDIVTVSYTKPTGSPLQTSTGTEVSSFSAQSVKNNLVQSSVPVYVSSSIENATPTKLDIIYNMSLASVVPSPSAFIVIVNSGTRNISSVAVSGTKVTLTLASAVAFSEVVTVAYTKPASNPLQSTSGGQVASMSAKSVTNKVGAPAPLYTGSAIENATPSRIDMTYSLSLANIIPSASSYSVKVNSVARAVSSVTISGTKVVLTLTSPVAYGDVVSVAYTKPSVNPVQSTAGGQAASLSAQSVTNKLLPPVPAFVSASIENATPSRIDITYNLTLSNVVPAAASFTVNVNSVARTVASVAISGTKVLLTLSSAVVYGDVVTVAYTKPASNPLKTAAGGEAVSFTAKSVSNKVGIVNTPPVIVISYNTTVYSGFVSELDASGSYDSNKDNLSFSWVIPNNIPVSSTTGSKIQFLSPVVTETQRVEFKLNISDGMVTQTKSVPVDILPYEPGLDVAEVVSVEASSYLSPNYPYNILDGNIGTMWSVNGDNQWLVLELKEPFSVQHIKLAFQTGQKKESYFDILGSEDNVNWESIMIKSNSCSFSGNLQVFDFPPSKTGKEFRYIKLVGHCNSIDTWNYISEFRIFGYTHNNPSSYENQLIKVYPNPAQAYINVKIEDATIMPDFIRIISLSGKILVENKIDPGVSQFQMPIDLMKGIYVVQVGEGKMTIFSQKLIVNN